MEATFENLFKNSITNPPPIGMVMKYNIYRADKNNQSLVFVEGSSDEKFYGKTKHKDLSLNSKYIYQDYAENNGGKESVFFAYNQIKKNADLQEDVQRCVFIVDRDWDSSLRSVNKWVSKKDEPFITVTLGHSMECYFLEEENIEVIFQNLNIANKLVDFQKIKEKFIDSSLDYWAYKSVIQYANKMDISCRYKKKYGFDQIFSFDFSKEIFFREDFMSDEIELMKKAIQGNEQLERYFTIWKKKIKEEPRFIRGHDYFNLLLAYIRFVLKKNIPERTIFDFANQMNVLIDIKKIIV